MAACWPPLSLSSRGAGGIRDRSIARGIGMTGQYSCCMITNTHTHTNAARPWASERFAGRSAPTGGQRLEPEVASPCPQAEMPTQAPDES
eukprot:5191003-Pyramimonas_sp.AAC.1